MTMRRLDSVWKIKKEQQQNMEAFRLRHLNKERLFVYGQECGVLVFCGTPTLTLGLTV